MEIGPYASLTYILINEYNHANLPDLHLFTVFPKMIHESSIGTLLPD